MTPTWRSVAGLLCVGTALAMAPAAFASDAPSPPQTAATTVARPAPVVRRIPGVATPPPLPAARRQPVDVRPSQAPVAEDPVRKQLDAQAAELAELRRQLQVLQRTTDVLTARLLRMTGVAPSPSAPVEARPSAVPVLSRPDIVTPPSERRADDRAPARSMDSHSEPTRADTARTAHTGATGATPAPTEAPDNTGRDSDVPATATSTPSAPARVPVARATAQPRPVLSAP